VKKLPAQNAQFTANVPLAQSVAPRNYVKKMAALNVKPSANLLVATPPVLLLNPNVLPSVNNLTAKTNALNPSTALNPSVNSNVNVPLAKLKTPLLLAALAQFPLLLKLLSLKPTPLALVL